MNMMPFVVVSYVSLLTHLGLFHSGPFGISELILEMYVFCSCLESQLVDDEYKLSCFMLYILVFEPNIVSHYIIHQCWFGKLWPFLKVRSLYFIIYIYIFYI